MVFCGSINIFQYVFAETIGDKKNVKIHQNTAYIRDDLAQNHLSQNSTIYSLDVFFSDLFS